ncbi:MAG: ADP-ribosylglycohydrolase family protein [Lachnospiraceae bacterium]|nr:ADP-ribosylglycohydrolase family protein [Lachnospiraceae bacterium]
MYGAIFGDIIGSRFEFDNGGKTKEFELFTKEDNWTDDSVMTIAIMEALVNAGKDADVETIRKECIKSMQDWGQRYPYAGYGSSFINWVHAKDPKPYNSFGNGSAMRVSAAGWIYDTVERTREVARATAEVSHNHPEGIKGAECTAAVMFLARTGVSKEEIKEYVIREFGYDVSKTVDELRPLHEHIEWCQDSLPKALASFFEGDSYEDVVRNAVSLGGDTDTLAAIAGAMGDAMYGVPIGMIVTGIDYLEEDMKETLDIFRGFLDGEKPDPYRNNKFIKMAAENFSKDRTEDNLYKMLDVLFRRMMEDGEAPVAMVDVNNVLASIDVMGMSKNDTFTLEHGMRLRIDTVQRIEGEIWIPLYTDMEELGKMPTTNLTMNMPIYEILKNGLADDVEGIVINPFGLALQIPKVIMNIIVKRYEELKGVKEDV